MVRRILYMLRQDIYTCQPAQCVDQISLSLFVRKFREYRQYTQFDMIAIIGEPPFET